MNETGAAAMVLESDECKPTGYSLYDSMQHNPKYIDRRAEHCAHHLIVACFASDMPRQTHPMLVQNDRSRDCISQHGDNKSIRKNSVFNPKRGPARYLPKINGDKIYNTLDQ